MLSDITFCKKEQTYVLTDQTQHECMIEYGCLDETQCPLCGCFADENTSFGEMNVLEKQRD